MDDVGPFSPDIMFLARCLGRGGILDKHLGETGLSVEVGDEPTSGLRLGAEPRDLLQLSAKTRNNPRGLLCSVDVQPLNPANPIGNARGAFELILTYGTGKGRGSALIDLRNGVQFVVPANILNLAVRIRPDAIDPALGVIVLPFLRVSGNIGYGDRPGGAAALTRTTAQTPILVNGASSIFFAVPQYATRVAWSSQDDPTVFAPPACVLVGQPSTVAVGRVEQRDLVAAGTFVPLQAGTRFVRIDNIGGAARYALVFELTL